MEAASFILEYPRAELSRHPDFHHQKIESLGIKDSHNLKNKSSVTPLLGDKKVFIIELSSLTLEASNALLKLFEDPPGKTYFFIITSSVDIIIPTLRSRSAVIEFNGQTEENNFCFDFLSAPPNKRMNMIKKMEKDKNEAMGFLNGLERIIENDISKNDRKLTFQERLLALEETGVVREFLLIRSPNVKMVLEHLALTLPKMLQ